MVLQSYHYTIYHLRSPSLSEDPQSILIGSPLPSSGELGKIRYYGIFYDEDVADPYARDFVGSPHKKWSP